MIDQDAVRRVAPERLSQARDLAHKAIQLVTKAARANLAQVADDSHSNLGWDPDRGAFLSHALAGRNGATVIGFAVSGFNLMVLRGGREIATRRLAGAGDAEAAKWLDAQLTECGLEPAASTVLPYDPPASVARIDTFTLDGIGEELKVLASWFGLAEKVLTATAEKNAHLRPGPSPVRCWPHHFDIATYIGLEQGESETARGIGVGMSPGDETYGAPYFYINPWPRPDPDRLPPLPAPGHWHTQGFVGAIATARGVLSLSDIEAELPQFIAAAMEISRRVLGA